MKIFHHNDLDGRCAGAIAFKYAMGLSFGYGIETIEVDYKDVLPLYKIRDKEMVVIVDFSFPPEDMEMVLKKTEEVIWIDHHKTAERYPYQHLKGLRDFKDKNKSGCELTWEYFFTNDPIPRAVSLIGDRDKWAWRMGPDTTPFNQGLKLYDTRPESKLWEYLFERQGMMDKQIIEEGKMCVKFRDSLCYDYAKRMGFETEFEGHKSFAMGICMFGSEAFGSRIREYPLCISFEFDGEKFTVGLYSEKIDVSEICKKHGGGGHKGAGGFVCNSLPFKKT